MRDLNDLYFFVQAVDHGGFAPAARALGMPKSRLSRRIATLEARLGVRLIQRTTRRFVVTEIGQSYYHHCVAMLVEADAADDVVARLRAEPQGRIKLSSPSALVYFQVGDMLARFMAAHPRVAVHLDSTNRRVDVIAEGFDLALRVRSPSLEDSDLVMKVLGQSRHRLVASPEFLTRHASPETPADLAALPSVDLGSPVTEHTWILNGPNGARVEVHHQPRFFVDDMVALCSAARHAIGIAQLPALMVDTYLSSGELREVLPMWIPDPHIVHAVFPSRRGLLPAVRALLDHFAAEFSAIEKAESVGN